MAITPGIHSSCLFLDFDMQERAVIETISKDWFVTNSGNLLTFNQNVSYKFILVKPTDNLQHAFNLERELVLKQASLDPVISFNKNNASLD
jgi:hypothetical protein